MRFLTNTAVELTEFTAFRGKPYFGVKCSCNKACVAAVSDEQATLIEADPVIGLHLLPPVERQGLVDFWKEHSALGHQLEPTLCEIASLKELTS